MSRKTPRLLDEWHNRWPPVIERLSAEDRAAAKASSAQILKKLKGKRSYTGLEDPQRYFIGDLAEMALERHFRRCELDFERTVRRDGKSDRQDFLLRMNNGKRYKVNVKNSLRENARDLMMPKAQHDLYHQDYYVGATGIDYGTGGGVDIYLWGVINRTQFDAQMIERALRCRTLCVPLLELPRSLQDFVDCAMQREIAGEELFK